MNKETKTTPVIDNEELAAAEKEAAKTNTNAFTYKLSAPFSYEGKTYEELTFDWSKLKGSDSLAIENELQGLGKPLIVPEFSGEYLIRVAVRACTVKISTDALIAMPLLDYNKIRSRARSFLMKTGS